MQAQQRFQLKCAVHGVLQKPNGEVFLLRRFQTGWRDGKFSLPAGHMDGGETATNAAIREIGEETGVKVLPEDMTMVHVMHRREEEERVDFFFLVKKWQGEPRINEPDKADQKMWVSPQHLPKNTVHYIAFFFEQLAAGKIYSEFAWE